jgi:hypothetical protein
MITIESADISNGENNGLRLINTSGTDHYWHITNGQTGVSNENFTIRDGTNNRDIVVLETSSGNATFYNRIILGGGITFPASQNASSNANTLDDYEEGTWTPVYYNITDGANVTATYDDTRYGFYTKIGRVVTLSCYMRTDALTAPDATDLIGIGGLPFTVSAGSDGHPLYPTSRFLITASDWSDAPQTISVGENEAFARLNAEVSANIETDTGVHTLGNDFTAGTTANRNAIAFSITYQV